MHAAKLTTLLPTLLRKGMAFGLSLFFSFFIVRCAQPALTVEDEAQLLAEGAAAYLWAQQAEDGGWHSRTHALLRSGQALTPFILFTLNEADLGKPAGTEDALEFIRQHTNEMGVLGLSDPIIVEYPNYATAYALRALKQVGLPQDAALIRLMRAYLLDQQFDESRAVKPSHPAYGGWGFGETNLPAGSVGYVDLSHTRRILQALQEASIDRDTVYLPNALHFLGQLQHRYLEDSTHLQYADGGFHYSPVVGLANKGKSAILQDTTLFLSYATATCDGVLALLASGEPKDGNLIGDALAWLNKFDALERAEGIPVADPAQWHRVMFFYHLAVRSEVYDQVGWPADAKSQMLQLIKEHAREDGSFVNEEGAPNKENDPLLATTLALTALYYIAK